MEQWELDGFMSDPMLAEILEQAKITDDIFDVINLFENQHSDMLAWSLNPNEGHGQGDAVIKDFLIAAYEWSEGAAYQNKKFFETWRPSKIRTASFGAAFLLREQSIKIDAGERNGRLDMFLVDPVNQIVIVIENKAGQRISAVQLENYWQAIQQQFVKKSAFQKYQFAYVVLDKELSDSVESKTYGTKWVALDYSWLKTSATRAQMQVDRANQAVRLLAAYCQRQTGWEADDDERYFTSLAVRLAVKHEPVIKRLGELRREKIASWTPGMLRNDDADLRLFLYQHRTVCEALLAGSGIASVVEELRGEVEQERLDVGRVWLAIAPEGMDDIKNSNPVWPLFVSVQRESEGTKEHDADVGRSRFRVSLRWVGNSFASDVVAEGVQDILQAAFPDLKKRQSSNNRRFIQGKGLESKKAAELALGMVKTLTEGLAAWKKKNQ